MTNLGMYDPTKVREMFEAKEAEIESLRKSLAGQIDITLIRIRERNGAEAEVDKLRAENETMRKKAADLYAEVNAYMRPTASRMSSREGLRQALHRYEHVEAAS